MWMLERMFPYKYCTDEAFPWCGLNCVLLSHLLVSKSTGICYICMAFHVCGYVCAFSIDLQERMILYTLYNYKASHFSVGKLMCS